ncbi:MAG: N-6 DNA methylase [Candidatus Heimdallarchaeum aukensis]|uniref:site-specific DNA-methyltransferase (adenine-specific) n=1 Tax=Candidatus Heimdallarchaeum aukensis TaxID=2876573 RepID=A0A9Y1FLU5_9ARCH|nr:MAG: N-6 DNA methylase [Candidatus Heimdallarchaeum aukensis]
MSNTDKKIEIFNNLFLKIKKQIIDNQSSSKLKFDEREVLLNSFIVSIKTLLIKEMFLKEEKVEIEKKINLNYFFIELDNIFREIFTDGSFRKADLEIIREKSIQQLILQYLESKDSIIIDLAGKDLFSQIYETALNKNEKDQLGLFYTPEIIVNYILNLVNYKTDSEIVNKKILDPSCGSGSFLVKSVNRLLQALKKENLEESEILYKIRNAVFGIDIDPIAVFLSKTNILFQIFPLFITLYKKRTLTQFPPLHVYCFDSLNKKSRNKDTTSFKIINREKEFTSGFDFIVGNPPYIESKKMDIETKKKCIENFPEICKGAFDIYICFIQLGLDLLSVNGKLGFIIPNKFLSANYSKALRKKIIYEFDILHLVDLSSSNIFKNASVYPIIISIKKRKSKSEGIKNNFLISKVEGQITNIEEIKGIPINQSFFKKTVNNFIFSFPNDLDEAELVKRLIMTSPFKLGEFLKISWSVSFHRKGLREQFVFTKNVDGNFRKILGGKKFGGNSEVKRYLIQWDGHWIDYNREKAKRLNNPFPPLSLFNNEKIIICQNSKRIRAVLDKEGFICKDIFFVAKITPKTLNTSLNYEVILSVINSKLMSYLYDRIFSSTHVSGRYLHYLPTYLHSLPFPKLSEIEKKQLHELTKKIMKKEITEKDFIKIDKEIDKIIYNAFGLENHEIEIVEKYVSSYMSLKKLKDIRK